MQGRGTRGGTYRVSEDSTKNGQLGSGLPESLKRDSLLALMTNGAKSYGEDHDGVWALACCLVLHVFGKL